MTLSFYTAEQKKLAVDTLESKLDDVPLKTKSSSRDQPCQNPAKKPKVQRSLDFLFSDTEEDSLHQNE